jgi:D-psicose/D-tagatose/L-ribulose 3-epimerase
MTAHQLRRNTSRRTFLTATVTAPLGAASFDESPSPAPRIRLGACSPTREFDVLDSLGFDYIEPGAAEIADMTPDQFASFKAKVSASRIRCEAFNSLIRRKDLVVVGPTVDLSPVLEYLDGALDRCKQLGATCIVWGSAGSRNVPPDFSAEKAWDQIAVFLSKAGPIAAKYGLSLSIEPLNRRESNILSTGHEAWRMVQQVNHPNVQFMIDYYHLTLENESRDIFEIARGHITHLHFSLPVAHRRVWPSVGENDPNAKPFFEELRKVGWSGGLSIEGSGSPEKDGASALSFLRDAVKG